jgi:hypothetical protein
MPSFKKNTTLSLFLIVVLAMTGFMCGRTLQSQSNVVMAPAVEETVTPDVYGELTILKDDEEVDPVADVAQVVVNAQELGEVGELIRFDVSESNAESFKWLLVPESVDFEVYDDGKRAVFSARKPGEYMFIVACAYKGTVDVTTHVVTIVGPDPQPDPDDPDEYPVVPKPAEGASLVEWMPYWCSQAKRPKDETMRLAASFESVAATISAGVNTTPQEIIAATGDANRQALGASMQAWMPVLQNLQAVLKTRAEVGTLTTADQHAEAWREIAEGLRGYAALFTKAAVLK